MKTKVLVMILSAVLCAGGPVYAQQAEYAAGDDVRAVEENAVLMQDAAEENTAPAAVSIDKRWYAGAGIGSQIFFGRNDHYMKFGDRLSPSAYLKAGYRITNVVGLELKGIFSRFSGVCSPIAETYNFGTGKLYDNAAAGQMWILQEGWFRDIYLGVTVDFLNWFCGVNPGRGSSVVLSVGGGLARGYGDNVDVTSDSINADIMYDWRFRGSRWSINATLRGALVGQYFDGESCPYHTFHCFAGLDIGACFRF